MNYDENRQGAVKCPVQDCPTRTRSYTAMKVHVEKSEGFAYIRPWELADFDEATWRSMTEAQKETWLKERSQKQ